MSYLVAIDTKVLMMSVIKCLLMIFILIHV